MPEQIPEAALRNMARNLWDKLGERERKVWLTVGQRILNGQRKYGELKARKKVWKLEALEEHLDSCVYISAELNDYIEMAFDRAVADAETEVKEPQNGSQKAEENSAAGTNPILK